MVAGDPNVQVGKISASGACLVVAASCPLRGQLMGTGVSSSMQKTVYFV